MSDGPKTAHPNCSAHHCPCLGTMSRSTTGSDEWFCFIHFSTEPKRWGDISAELNRLGWLVAITRALRLANGNEKAWCALSACQKEIKLNQSSHLERGAHEGLTAWLIRLEGALQQTCAAPAPETVSMFENNPEET